MISSWSIPCCSAAPLLALEILSEDRHRLRGLSEPQNSGLVEVRDANLKSKEIGRSSSLFPCLFGQLLAGSACLSCISGGWAFHSTHLTNSSARSHLSRQLLPFASRTMTAIFPSPMSRLKPSEGNSAFVLLLEAHVRPEKEEAGA